MSKIAIFVGRRHHALKLMEVGRYLSFRGHEVYPITANNAINIDPPQENLGGYVHVYNYLGADDISLINDYLSTNEVDSAVPQFWKDYSLREQLLVITAFDNWLKSDDKPDAVFVLHENNFWTKPLSFLCDQLNIPCFAFQEGLLRKKDQDDMRKQTYAAEYVKKLFVWGEDSKRQYLEAGVDEEKIVVSGPPHLTAVGQRVENERKKVVYFLPLLQHYYGNPQKDVEQLSAFCRKYDMEFVVRPHPFENELDVPFVTDKREDITSLILETDIALVQHSTTALECLALRTPVIEVGFGSKTFLEPLHKEQPLIPTIKSYDDLHKIARLENYIPDIQDWIDEMILVRPNTLDVITEEIGLWL